MALTGELDEGDQGNKNVQRQGRWLHDRSGRPAYGKHRQVAAGTAMPNGAIQESYAQYGQ